MPSGSREQTKKDPPLASSRCRDRTQTVLLPAVQGVESKLVDIRHGFAGTGSMVPPLPVSA